MGKQAAKAAASVATQPENEGDGEPKIFYPVERVLITTAGATLQQYDGKMVAMDDRFTTTEDTLGHVQIVDLQAVQDLQRNTPGFGPPADAAEGREQLKSMREQQDKNFHDLMREFGGDGDEEYLLEFKAAAGTAAAAAAGRRTSSTRPTDFGRPVRGSTAAGGAAAGRSTTTSGSNAAGAAAAATAARKGQGTKRKAADDKEKEKENKAKKPGPSNYAEKNNYTATCIVDSLGRESQERRELVANVLEQLHDPARLQRFGAAVGAGVAQGLMPLFSMLMGGGMAGMGFGMGAGMGIGGQYSFSGMGAANMFGGSQQQQQGFPGAGAAFGGMGSASGAAAADGFDSQQQQGFGHTGATFGGMGSASGATAAGYYHHQQQQQGFGDAGAAPAAEFMGAAASKAGRQPRNRGVGARGMNGMAWRA